ncbi:MAG: BlaI/MecI/CopY family transcriptional regulator [Lachnospiraceae bacterium]|nr:BlaI/MecI/CopY family transcriptional regulator [Lachnospiraceae bacterium]
MEQLKLGEMEQKFAEMIWRLAPVKSGELVRRCEDEFGWKKSTTFTMLKRLCERGIFRNDGGTVCTLMTEEEFHAARSEQFVQETYNGSIPLFLAAFTKRRKLSGREVEEIRQLIDAYDESSNGEGE